MFEKEDRYAILFRYNTRIYDGFINSLNYGEHHCIALKKDATNFVFMIEIQGELPCIFGIVATFDHERYCFDIVGQPTTMDKFEDYDFRLDKIKHLEGDYNFAFKSTDAGYLNVKAIEAASKLYEELYYCPDYDTEIHELLRQEEIEKRKEEEDRNANMQLEVWKQYVEKEMELLNKANKPFALDAKPANINKNSADIETLPFITQKADESMLEEIVGRIGGKVSGSKLIMSSDEFRKWRKYVNESQEESTMAIHGKATVKITVGCDGYWNAKNFKMLNGYGRELYFGSYNNEKESIDLRYESDQEKELDSFLRKAYDSFEFRGVDKKEAIYEFSLDITIKESDEERRKRIETLAGKDIYSENNMKGIHLGTLSKNGSDKRRLRIILPKDKEAKKKAKDFFNNIGDGILYIYPGLLKDRALLNREKKAIKKLSTGNGLSNPKLKDFIFNSSRATPTNISGFSDDSISSTDEYKDCEQSKMLRLNPSQQAAVVKGLYATDLCLLQGPPGTGKTTVISELIWQHIRKDQSVKMMLTSQTNLAIDNALNRLFSNSAVEKGSNSWRNLMLIKPSRRADTDKVEEEGMPFTMDRIQEWISGTNMKETSNNIVGKWMQHISERVPSNTKFDDILIEWKNSLTNPNAIMRRTFANQYHNDVNLLCMTCGKVDSNDFKEFEGGNGFNVVIVDEASKATPPELLMPLCYARKSIIIGDHRQLPPVLFENEFFNKIREIDPELVNTLDNKFKKDLIENSLFKRLITHPYLSPTIKATFNIQYRMHPDINDIIQQFYKEDSGGLSCGLDKHNVNIPNFDNRDSRWHGFSFGRFIRPNVHTIWIDVPEGREQGGEGSSTFNEKEAEAVRVVLEALTRADGFKKYMDYWRNHPDIETRITESKIGVISFYAAQVQKIREKIQSFCDKNDIKVATKSVDKFQGQENGIVIVSTVRTHSLGFTRTPERLNVALSRARRLLIIVGNSDFYLSEKAKTDDGKFIYRNVIEKIKSPDNDDVFINYKDLKAMLGI